MHLWVVQAESELSAMVDALQAGRATRALSATER